MSKPKVFLTRQLPDAAMARLKAGTDLEMNPHDRYLTREELLAGVKNKDGLLCLLTDTIDAGLMDAGSKLKVIADYAVGYNNIDVAAANSRGIVVTNTPGVLTETSADLAFALILAIARRVVEGDRFLRSGRWKGWGPLQFLGTDIYGATLGIIGMGRIGQSVARRARSFGMRVIYWNRTPLDKDRIGGLDAEATSFDSVLQEADFVSVHTAYNKETLHLIGAEQFKLMKHTAFIINTARGPIIDEKALANALKSGLIAGAGLDVYEEEPLVTPELITMENVVLLPHLGSATTATRTRMAMVAIDNLMAVLEGRPAPNSVNKEIKGK